MKKFPKILLNVISALYPVLVFLMLVVFRLPVRVLSLCIMVLAISFFLSGTSAVGNRNSDSKKALDWRPMFSSALFLIVGIACFVTQQSLFLKLYSVSVSVIFFLTFA